MILKKSRDASIDGMLGFVKANMSLGSPGTAAEMSFLEPKAERISESSSG